MRLFLVAAFAAVLITPSLLAQEADSMRKVQADFKKAGQDDDRIDDAEMKSLGGRALAIAKTKKGRIGYQGTLWTFYICKYGDSDTATRQKLRRQAMDIVLERYTKSFRSMKDIVAEWRVLRAEDVPEFSTYYAELEAATTKADVKKLAREGAFSLLTQKAESGMSLTDAERKRVLAHWKKLVADKGDEINPKDRQKRNYRDSLKGKIFVLENLYIGAQAPEITASDLDGVGFKLSDYRGKVVMLDFWGHW